MKTRDCIKCGSTGDDSLLRYQRKIKWRIGYGEEYIEITCTVCGYKWHEDPLDKRTDG